MRGKTYVFVFTYLIAIGFTIMFLAFAIGAYMTDGPVRLWFDNYHENVPEIILLTAMLLMMFAYLPEFIKVMKQ